MKNTKAVKHEDSTSKQKENDVTTTSMKRKLSDVEGKEQDLTGSKKDERADNSLVPKKKEKKNQPKKFSHTELNENHKNGQEVPLPDASVEDLNNDASNEKKRKLNEVDGNPTQDAEAESSTPRVNKKKKKKKPKESAASVENKENMKSNEVDGNQTQEAEAESSTPSVNKKKKKKKKKKKSANSVENKENLKNNDSEKETGDKAKKKKKKKRKGSLSIGGSESLTCSVMDEQPFSSLQDKVTNGILEAVAKMGCTKMTPIQAKAIPPLLEGKDVRGTAKTGSGKTLAFIIPTVENLLQRNFKPADGTGALIISPTRELSLQTYNVLNKVIKNLPLTSALIMGGVELEEEAKLFEKGVNILVATPGRLLNHLENTKDMVIKNLACIVIDEADCLLDVGFEEDMNKIIALLPKERQTMFFSATRDKKVNLLARLSLNSEPVEIEEESIETSATVDELEQAYTLCTMDKKFLVLHHFLEKNKKKKVMVFFTTCNAVQFYHTLLGHLGLDNMHIHGKQKQEVRTAKFYEFCKADTALLLCTDVASRGWDIPAVDWIVQFDPPEEPKEYIHRVGRTARAGNNGKALLFIREEEKGLLDFLKNQKVALRCEDLTWNKYSNLQILVEKNVRNKSGLKNLAIVTLMSYIRAHLDCKRRDIYSLKSLDVKKLAKCLGFETVPPLSKKLQEELDSIFVEKKGKGKVTKKISSKAKKLAKKGLNRNNPSGFPKLLKHGGKKWSSKSSPEGVWKNEWNKNDHKEKHVFKTNKVFKAKHKFKA